jgi:hypothetical protein
MKRLIVLLMVVLATACEGDEEGTTGGAGSTRPAITGPITDATAPIPVPDLVGLSPSQARSALQAVGLRRDTLRRIYSEELQGTVVKQGIDPGTLVRNGRRIKFTIARPLPRPFDGNPWGYNFHCCTFIRETPSEFCSYFKCVPNFTSGVGWIIQCGDRAFSQSGEEYFVGDPIPDSPGTCYGHRGIYRPLLQLRGHLVDPADRILGTAQE